MGGLLVRVRPARHPRLLDLGDVCCPALVHSSHSMLALCRCMFDRSLQFVNNRGVGWSPAGTFRSRGGSLKRARPQTGAPSSQERAPRMGHSSEFAPRGHPRLPSSLVSETEPTPSASIIASSFVRVQLVFEAIASFVIIVLNSIMICKPVSLREQFATQAMAELGMCKYVFLTSGGKAIGGHRSSREMADCSA